MADGLVVRLARVVQALEVVKHLLDLGVLAVDSLEELLVRAIEASLLDILDLVLVSVLFPWQLDVEKFEQDEKEAPNVVLATKFFLEVGGETRVGNSSAEISVTSRWVDEPGAWVHMVFGETKVNEVHFVLVIAAAPHHEVRRLDVTVYQPSLVHVFDARQHLKEQVDRVGALELFRVTLLV